MNNTTSPLSTPNLINSFKNQKPTILCVDDEKIVLDSLKVQLRDYFGENCQIELAESGEEALEIIEEMQETSGTFPALIISDQIMPNMKGDQLLTSIKSKFPNCLSILLTGQAELNDVISAINKAGLYRFISKPWNKQDLNLTVEQALIAFQKESEIKVQSEQLKELNKNLESKVKQRTEFINIQKKQLEQQNDEIQQSLNYAKRIQNAFLSSPDDLSKYFRDYFIYYSPFNTVSGDFYLVKKVKNLIYVSLGDCTGHGVPGAFMSMIGYKILSDLVRKGVQDTSLILRDLHKEIVKALNQKYSGVQDGMDISLLCFDTITKKVNFSGAKHDLFVANNNDLTIHKGNKVSIGGTFRKDREFSSIEFDYRPSMNFYLTSDGFYDQFGGEKDKKFGKRQFIQLLSAINSEALYFQKDILEETLLNWKKDRSQIDDITVLGFKIK